MLAAVYHGPNDLRVENVPVPKMAKGKSWSRLSAPVFAEPIYGFFMEITGCTPLGRSAFPAMRW